jgi:hypothetical protein
MEVGGQSQDPVDEPRGKKPGTHFTAGRVGPRTGLNGCRKFNHTGIRFQDRLARSESLYQLRCLGLLCTAILT